MIYYKTGADGNIIMYAENETDAAAFGLTETTDRAIVRGYDGKLYFEGETPTRPVTASDYDAALEEHLRAERTARGYTTREPTAYGSSSVERWRQDAADWAAHLDAVMQYGLEVQSAAASGGDVPTLEEFKAALPRIAWTAALSLMLCASSVFGAAVRMTPLDTFVAGTNAALSAANAYTDSAIQGAGSVSPAIVTNITTSVVTKEYVEGLGIDAGVSTNVVCDIVTNVTDNISWSNLRYWDDTGTFDPETSLPMSALISVYYRPDVGWWDDVGGSWIIVANDPDGNQCVTGHDGDFTGTELVTYDYAGAYGFKLTVAARSRQNALGLARLTDLTSATNSLGSDIATLQSESALIYRLYSGSNVICEVTNYNSLVHAPTMRLLQLTESNTYITVWTETNGLTRIARAATNYTDAAVLAATSALPDTYAPRAWSRTTSGLGSEAPSNTTWISTPTTVFAGGLEFEKAITTSGQLWFLGYSGVQQVWTNQASCIALKASDGTDIFSVEKTDSYLVGVDADSIVVSGNTVTMALNVVAEQHPYVRYAPSLLTSTWESEENGFTSDITVVWSGSSGAWTCTVTTSATSGFFYFEYLQEGGTKIVNGGVMDVSAGILCTDGVHKVRPVYNNGSVTWEAF